METKIVETTAAQLLLQQQQVLFESSPLLWAAFGGAMVGTIMTLFVTLVIFYKYLYKNSPAMRYHDDRRHRLPATIILIRHGESEANADKSIWKTVPDNLVNLTPKGRLQATAVGKRVEKILQAQNATRVHLVISPFERTLQTASYLRQAFESRIVRTDIESRIREQEMGNLQGDSFTSYRQQQLRVGRFWYRFPTGESGADVLDRVKSWWYETVLTVNLRVGYEPVDAMVVVTHGLTMRHILMQLFGWSPTTFHSVWNAGNCDMYVLQRELSKPGSSPYILSETLGDMPQSSIQVAVTLKNGKEMTLKLEDYLSIPPPRTTRTKLVKYLLAQQYPDIIPNPKSIRQVLFMPFIEGGVIRGRSVSGVASNMSGHSIISDNDNSDENDENDDNDDEEDSIQDLQELTEDDRMDIDNDEDKQFRAMQEKSFRYPVCKISGFNKSLGLS